MSPNSNNDRPFNRFVRNVLDKSTEVEYDSSWEFNVTFLSHLAAVCLNIIKEEKYKKIIVSVVSRQVTSRYKLGKDILSSFGITVKPIDKNAKTNEPEIDWNIYSQLNLPTMEYPEGIAEIIKDLQTIGF
jgi:dTDP-4-dehydrorhamnose reductase